MNGGIREQNTLEGKQRRREGEEMERTEKMKEWRNSEQGEGEKKKEKERKGKIKRERKHKGTENKER